MTLTAPVRPAPLEPTTPIKPSEAIRLGCLIAPVQAFGIYIEGKEACAMGAAYLGWGDGPNGTSEYSYEALARLLLIEGQCPVAPEGPHSMPWLVEHLNDDHRWAREAIADWLAEQGL